MRTVWRMEILALNQKFLLVDTLNVFFRAKHMAPPRADTWTKVGFALHIMLSIVNKSWRKESPTHVVFCLEGSSWRKAMYAPYKKNREVLRAQLTEKEVEEDVELFSALMDFQEFLVEKTNITVLRNEIAEADDMIARWIHAHPDDDHVILSSDSDFYQLLSDNVNIYNGMGKELITTEGYFDDRGKRVKHSVKARDDNDKLLKDANKKQIMIKEEKPAPRPEWELFFKCMRGDTSDNIFSAYPGVREKGSSTSPGLREAFADKDNRGFAWNNLMLQRWPDHKGVEHRVLDDYLRNVALVDLTAIPEDIKEFVDETITENATAKEKRQVGRHFLRFCGKYELKKVAQYSEQYTEWLRADYVE